MLQPILCNDDERLEALRRYGILDTPVEDAFDEITRLASFICDAPMSIISLLDEGRQWFKSEVGVGARETPLDTSICAHAAAQPDPVFIVPDTLDDERFASMSLIVGEPHLRFYAGAVLRTPEGIAIGSLCVLDVKPRALTENQTTALLTLAHQVMTQLELRRSVVERENLLESERAARSEAERVGRMKDDFLATLSHELRTPLNAILGWSQLLSRRSGNDEEFIEGLDVIERNTRVQVQLIDDLLDMSRIISGKVRLDVQTVEIQEVVRASIASIRHSADAKKIRLQVVLDPNAGPVRGDPGRLQQCFWNLLSNAVKFTPKGGTVQVGLQRINSHLEICIVDSGKGIKPEFLPHVFERFRQADASTTRQTGGLGLGLAIVKNLVELHGGTVRVESKGEGHGATFCIELPLMVVHATESGGTRSHPASSSSSMRQDYPSLTGIRVVVVDDEEDARNLVKRLLEQCGAVVFIAKSASDGLNLVKLERPDMIISDVGMPGEDGYGFIRKLRKLPVEEGGKTPAAALTAFARAEDRTRALLAGFQTHVSKPVEPMELTAVVASLAARRD